MRLATERSRGHMPWRFARLAAAAVSAAALGAVGAAAHEAPVDASNAQEIPIEQCSAILCMGAKLKAKIHELTKYEEGAGGAHKHKGFKVQFVIGEVVDGEKDQLQPKHNVFCVVSSVYVKVPGKKGVTLDMKKLTGDEIRVQHCIDPVVETAAN